MAITAMQMFAARRGLETGLAMNDAFQQQAQAELNSQALEIQMQEIETRTKMQIQNIYQQSEKVQSHQVAAFISGGVELSGSAMTVISDTIHAAAEAAYVRQRVSDYDRMGIAMEQHKFEQMASNETLYLNLAAATIGGV